MKHKNNYQTAPGERLSYGLYFIGQGLIYSLVSQHLMFYYTDYVHIATGIVTLIMTLSKIWDAVNDTLFGMAVDKIHFKSGNRFKPWLNFTTLLLPFGTLLVFSISSSLSQPVKVTYALATYILWDLLYTMCDVPIFAIVTAMTDNIKERSSIYTIAGVGGAVAAAVTTIFLVPFFDKHGFLKTAMLVGAVALVTMRPICHSAKERHKGEPAAQEGSSFKEMLTYLKGNRYFRYFIIYRLVSGSFYIQMMTYFAKYCIGDIKFVSVIMTYAVPVTVVLYLAAPFIIKRFEKIHIYRFCTFLYISAYILLYCVGWENRTLMIIVLLCALESAIIPNILAPAIPADCVEYGEYKTGIRKEGVTFALQTFTNKFCASMGTAISGLLLILIGYDGEVGVMDAAMQNALFTGMCWIPVIGQVIVLPLLFKYNLRDRDVQIMADCNSKKISVQEAQTLLSGKY